MVRTSTLAVRHLSSTLGALSLSLGLVGACTSSSSPRDSDSDATARAVTGLETPPDPVSCPTQPVPEDRAPDVHPAHEQADHWLAMLEHEAKVDLDVELLSPEARALLTETVAALPGGWRDPIEESVADPELVQAELDERLAWLQDRVATGKYVETQPGALAEAAGRITAATAMRPSQLRFVVTETPLWCVPTQAGLYTPPVDLDFDRNRCASLHLGELVRTLRATPDGAWIYVEAGHSVGWIDLGENDEALGPPVSASAARTRRDQGVRAVLTADFGELRAGSSFPLLGRSDDGVMLELPSPEGPVPREVPIDAPLESPGPAFTMRAVFEAAFTQLEEPYGWGGREGGRDCSRYLHDLFAIFGVRLPRNSSVQAKLGTQSVDLSGLDEAAKRAAIRAAAREGVVLLYMPGHIMLYLGHEPGLDGAPGLDYGLSALSEYLTPCPGGPDTVHRLDKVAVTPLELGRGTERHAFIERITRMAVFGPSPDPSAPLNAP